MGSCTSKEDKEVRCINKIPVSQQQVLTDKSPDPVRPNEEIKRRDSKKKLTVLSSTEDQFNEIQREYQELSLVRRPSLGKVEQGSLIIMKKKVTYGGVISSHDQVEFDDKVISVEGDSQNSLSENGIFIACKKGLKPESPNQDDFVIVIEDERKILGVFDGHGTHGHEISNFVHKHLPRTLIQSPYLAENPLKAISESFSQTHKDLVQHCLTKTRAFDCTLSGTTATLAYIKDSRIYLGHVGDSRAVLARRIEGELTAIDLTRDHKASLPDEQERIYRSGGEVRQMVDDVPLRVFCKGKNYPGIAMTRSIGDLLAQKAGVSNEAETSSKELTENDEFLLFCSDGVWEFIDSQTAVNEVSKYKKNRGKAAEALSVMAWNKWIESEDDVVDDITVLLVYLR